MTGDKIFATWYNNIYQVLTSTLPNNGITTGVTSKSVVAGNKVNASELNNLITDLNNIKTIDFLTHTTNCADDLTTATAGVTKIVAQDKIDTYINEIAQFCGNVKVSFTQTFVGGSSPGTGNNVNRCSQSCGDNNRGNFVCSQQASFTAFQGSSKTESGFFTNNNFSGYATSVYGRFSQSFSNQSNFTPGRSFANYTQTEVRSFGVVAGST